MGSAESRQRATAASLAARAARASSPLRQDFLDASHWADLASQRDVRLPIWGTPCATGAMTRWLKRAGLSVAWYRGWSGYQSLQQWIDANPLWPLRAFVGILLEERESADWHAALVASASEAA
jgi:hypothetical protein